MVVEDDASRYVLAGVESQHATTEATVECARQAYQLAESWNLHVSQYNTDRGTQFYNNKEGGQANGFQDVLADNDTEHVPSRVNNPQTNGKNERLWQEYDKHRDRFNNLQEFINWYNQRIHGALRLEWAETLAQAFQRKLPPETLIGLFYKQIGE